jgi:hypothetical protein
LIGPDSTTGGARGGNSNVDYAALAEAQIERTRQLASAITASLGQAS